MQIPTIPKFTFNGMCIILDCKLYLPVLVCSVLLSSADVSSWVFDRARSSQLDCPLLVLLLFRSHNPLHWSLASLLIWGTISPADGSLLKHHERSELIPISPLIPVISQRSSLSLDITPSFLTPNTWLFFPQKILEHFLNMRSNGVIVSALHPAFLETHTDCEGLAALI